MPPQRGHFLYPWLPSRVVGALGLAPSGSSRGTLPSPLQSGQSDIIFMPFLMDLAAIQLNASLLFAGAGRASR